MVSWRDGATQQVQDDLDGLLGPALGFAQQQLEKHGEFYPYAVVVDHDGKQRMVAADNGKDRPASADLITTLVATLSEERDHLRAAAIVATRSTGNPAGEVNWRFDRLKPSPPFAPTPA